MKNNQVPNSTTITQDELLMLTEMASIADSLFKDISVAQISKDLDAVFGILMDNNNDLEKDDEPQHITPEYLTHVQYMFGAIRDHFNKLYVARTNDLFRNSSRVRDYEGISNALTMERVRKVFAEVDVNN
jgi:hypothetical protein